MNYCKAIIANIVINAEVYFQICKPPCTLLAKTFRGKVFWQVYIFFVLWMSGNGMSLTMFKVEFE